jgi:hypothetical protein
VSSWVILLMLQEIVFTSPIFLPVNILCCVTLWITRNVLTSLHLVSRLLTAASACCISFGLEVSFVFLVLDCVVLCKSQDKMKTENKVPLNFKWVETNLHHLAFYFTLVTNLIRQVAFSENSLWYTSTVKVEIQFYFISDVERMKCSRTVSKILQSSPKDSDV